MLWVQPKEERDGNMNSKTSALLKRNREQSTACVNSEGDT